ncbi:hypothetical protein ACFVT5_34995 [Streptomyces sp. NPDC058001]|uniref:hypothetical protein n=1 Tax=Streptomyces sp. NPDC058001 TaxID=3346300 RepID=UPI0036E5D858
MSLAEEIAAANPTLDPAWRDAIAVVPRELFLDDAAFRLTGRAWEPVHRAEAGQDEWLRMVYSDQTVWIGSPAGPNWRLPL